MKKLIPALALCALTISCDKEEQHCPVIATESIPSEVIATFTSKYPNTTVENWYDKSGYYVAAFEKDGKDRFAKFSSDGSFQTEFKEDDSEYESGCECENEDND